MTKKKIEEQLQAAFPNSLDDIITKNRDELKFELATKEDLNTLERSIPITNLQGIFKTAFIYKWVMTGMQQPHLFVVGRLIGANETSGRHTSKIVGYDSSTNTVLTKSGSNYVINEFCDPETDSELLIFICAWVNKTQVGEYLGVPEWFF